jgi:tetrahydromethanopterin S-methyltransferase subunit G
VTPPSPEERIACLEGKVEEHSRGFDDLRQSISRIDGHVVALDGKVDRFRDELAARIDGLAPRFSALGSRMDALGSRIDALDQKVDRFRGELARQMTRQFSWLVGIQITVLLVVLGSLIE